MHNFFLFPPEILYIYFELIQSRILREHQHNLMKEKIILWCQNYQNILNISSNFQRLLGGLLGKENSSSERVNWQCYVKFRASLSELSKVMSVDFQRAAVNCWLRMPEWGKQDFPQSNFKINAKLIKHRSMKSSKERKWFHGCSNGKTH